MASQRQIPGGSYLNESDSNQRQIPGSVYVNEVASSSSTGTVAYTNANDTSSAAGTTTVVGTVAKTNANDTPSASGTTTVTGTSATTNAADTSSASGTTTVVGTSATTNANDTATASGIGADCTGTVAVTNANDACAASGSTPLISIGAAGKKRKSTLVQPEIVVVEIDGKLKRMTLAELDTFLETLEDRAEKVAPVVIAKGKKAKPHKVVLKAVDEEIHAEAAAMVKEANNEIALIWERARQKIEQDEEEEVLLMALMG